MNWRAWSAAAAMGTLSALAQEPAYLSVFSLTDQEDAVRLDWTMIAGSTCMGTDVMRSRDTLAFEVVGTLEGLCGNIDGPTNYTFTDPLMEFGTWYYRLALGLNGYSPIKRIEHQLSSTEELRVFPNPAVGQVTLVLRADERAEMDIEMIALDGRVVQRWTSTGNVHRLPVDALTKGMYLVVVRWAGRAVSGRIQVM